MEAFCMQILLELCVNTGNIVCGGGGVDGNPAFTDIAEVQK